MTTHILYYRNINTFDERKLLQTLPEDGVIYTIGALCYLSEELRKILSSETSGSKDFR